jgi:nucleoid-associated protein YgaU
MRLSVCLSLSIALLAACAAPRRLDAPPPRRPPSEQAAPSPRTGTALDTMTRRSGARTSAQNAVMPEIKPLNSFTPDPVPYPSPTSADKRQTDVPYLALAQQELQKSYQYTGLSDVQIAQQKNAESLLVLGSGQAAYKALLDLNAQLKNGIKPYAVKRGDNLWIISAKPEIYGNPWLWPLIWQNNLQVIPDPNRLAAGQQLKIRPNPTIDEVVNAVNYAREKAKTSDTHVGEVKEQP